MINEDGLGLSLKNMKKKVVMHTYTKRRGEREMGHTMMHGNGNTCKKGREEERERHTSNSGLSSNIGRVVDVSSLCLDCKKEKTKGRE